MIFYVSVPLFVLLTPIEVRPVVRLLSFYTFLSIDLYINVHILGRRPITARLHTLRNKQDGPSLDTLSLNTESNRTFCMT